MHIYFSGMENQATTLVERINSDNSIVDVENDWKIVSIFIGGNDLCRSCTDPVDVSYMCRISLVKILTN